MLSDALIQMPDHLQVLSYYCQIQECLNNYQQVLAFVALGSEISCPDWEVQLLDVVQRWFNAVKHLWPSFFSMSRVVILDWQMCHETKQVEHFFLDVH